MLGGRKAMKEYKIICRECNAEDSILSDERIKCTYKVYPTGSEDIDFDGSSMNTYDSTIERYFCKECNHGFTYSQVLEMIYTVAESLGGEE
tara:strand:+ start:3497 stop:3769 length:273 start_codon:yes stop_codon:yes gene_type:complete